MGSEMCIRDSFYSGFFEDPITWLAIAVGASALAARAGAADRLAA